MYIIRIFCKFVRALNGSGVPALFRVRFIAKVWGDSGKDLRVREGCVCGLMIGAYHQSEFQRPQQPRGFAGILEGFGDL